MDKNIINSHDKFFKSLFSRKEEAREFIEKSLPQDLVGKLDLDSLELDKTEYIDDNLQQNFSDIVYDCNYGEKFKVKITLLFEHKSYPEKYPHLQILNLSLIHISEPTRPY